MFVEYLPYSTSWINISENAFDECNFTKDYETWEPTEFETNLGQIEF